MKITTEKQRNLNLLQLLNEKVICLTLTEKKKSNYAPKVDAVTLAGARVYEKKKRRVLGRIWVR